MAETLQITIYKGKEKWSASIFSNKPKYHMVGSLSHHDSKEALLESFNAMQIAILAGEFEIIDENGNPME